MEITEKTVVELFYTLTVDGKVADKTTKEKPLDFIFGMGFLLPKFEENIKDKKAGDKFDFKLTAAEGYGEINSDAVVELPKNIFEQDGKIREDLLVVGKVIPMMNNQGGVMPGKVLEILESTVKLDFNHQMAGKNLHFVGEIISVRKANETELADGLHGEIKAQRDAIAKQEAEAGHSCDGCCEGCGSC
ncbi:MAG: FKBP-type peptidyl-prolyl cis-trans isomerase [Bacteroidales bacterium]